MSEFYCPIVDSKNSTAKEIMNIVSKNLNRQSNLNLIWLEATGCSGNIISMMNANNPDLYYFLKNIVNLKYNNSLMAAEGQEAYQQFLNTLDTEFILVVEGAVATKADGRYNIIASNRGLPVTAMEAVKLAGDKAKYIVAVGTCASYGGISAARPNPSGSISVQDYLKKNIVKVPGCPGHPEWVIGTVAHLAYLGMPELDEQGRPIIFYGITIHDRCSRRSYFDNGIFADSLGDKECMFKLGCRGPITKTDCPIRKWNDHTNWPIGDNTPCIGCARQGFPDGMEPFVRY